MRFLVIAALLALANCASAPPDTPPDPTPPPEVSTAGAVVINTQAILPMTVPATRDFLERRPLIGFLQPVQGLAPPVETRVIEGTWPRPGAVRRLQLADGHYVIERILENEQARMRYQVWVFTNAAGSPVEQIVGTQTFRDAGDGQTRFDWSYAIKPRNGFARLMVQRRRAAFEAYLGGATQRMAQAARAEVAQ